MRLIDHAHADIADLDHVGQQFARDGRFVTGAAVKGIGEAKPELRYQFERVGYFALDPDSRPGQLVVNRTIGLRDTWARETKQK